MRRVLLLLGLLSVVAVGCGSKSDAGKHEAASPTVPSAAAKMVCEDEAKADITEALGEAPTTPLTPTWRNSTYACTYAYPEGRFTLSVKELGSGEATSSYFEERGRTLKRRPDALAIGDAGFVAADDSVVIRKDFKVLTVDVSKLPAQFGAPPRPRLDVAESVAATIMGCWVGG